LRREKLKPALKGTYRLEGRAARTTIARAAEKGPGEAKANTKRRKKQISERRNQQGEEKLFRKKGKKKKKRKLIAGPPKKRFEKKEVTRTPQEQNKWSAAQTPFRKPYVNLRKKGTAENLGKGKRSESCGIAGKPTINNTRDRQTAERKVP